MFRGFWVLTLLTASLAWLIPYPGLIVLSAAIWLAVYFATLPKPRQRAVSRRSERGY